MSGRRQPAERRRFPRIAQELVVRYEALDIQPTLKVRPGWPLRVIVHKDLVLEPYQG